MMFTRPNNFAAMVLSSLRSIWPGWDGVVPDHTYDVECLLNASVEPLSN